MKQLSLSAIAIAVIAGTPVQAQLVSLQLAYPPAALRAGKEGVVGYEVKIAKSGKVTDCRITQSSGDALLDRETCSQIRKSAQFKPAVDTVGKPVQSTFSGRLTWRIPRPAAALVPPAAEPTVQPK